ncbi:hypothetical protein FA304_17325, partial [Pseudomonas aeruginosa]|nr:hypothetical protein [Pseudomonas aeruginosa]
MERLSWAFRGADGQACDGIAPGPSEATAATASRRSAPLSAARLVRQRHCASIAGIVIPPRSPQMRRTALALPLFLLVSACSSEP